MPEDIKELLEKQPFEPFVIVTSSGEKYLIDNPHGVALMTGRVFVAPKNEKWAFIKVGQITILARPRAQFTDGSGGIRRGSTAGITV